MSTSTPGRRRPTRAEVTEAREVPNDRRRRIARIPAFVADLRRLAPPGSKGVRARAVLERLLARPEAERMAALPAAFGDFARACAGASGDPEAVLDDLRLFVREHHPELLAERAFAVQVEGPGRRAALMAWLLRENAEQLESSRLELARRGNEVARLRADVQRLERERDALETAVRTGRTLADRGLGALGLVHDIHNLLQAIVGHSSIALERLAPGAEGREAFERFVAIGERAAELSRGLARWDQAEPGAARRLDVNAAVGDMLELASASAPANVRTTVALAPSLPRVLAHPNDVRRIVLNLLFNAWQALASRGGTVRVSTGLDAGGPVARVHVEVADDGPGFDPAALERLCEPFCTTREHGSGLGLPTVRRLLERDGGGLEVTSRPGEGARFRAWLPVAEERGGA